MTRKDFELIAEALRETCPIPDDPSYSAATIAVWVVCCNNLAWALTDSNPNFDRNRFLKSCGVES